MIYKYLDANGIDVIKNLRVLITRGSNANDAHDYYFSIDHQFMLNCLIEDIKGKNKIPEINKFLYKVKGQNVPDNDLIRMANENHEPFDELVAKFIEDYAPEFFKGLRQEIGMVCFSEKPNSILMWAHYCKNFTGFVIGLETKSIEPFVKTKSSLIEYVDIPPTIQLSWDLRSPINDNFLFKKYKEWKYEEEYRYLFDLTTSGQSGFLTENGKDYVLIDKKSISEIIVSENSDKGIVEYARNNFPGKLKIIRPLNRKYGLSLESFE